MMRLPSADYALRALVYIERAIARAGEAPRPVAAYEVRDRSGLSDRAVYAALCRLVDGGYVLKVKPRMRKRRTDGYKPRALGYQSTEAGRNALKAFRTELRLFLRS